MPFDEPACPMPAGTARLQSPPHSGSRITDGWLDSQLVLVSYSSKDYSRVSNTFQHYRHVTLWSAYVRSKILSIAPHIDIIASTQHSSGFHLFDSKTSSPSPSSIQRLSVFPKDRENEIVTSRLTVAAATVYMQNMQEALASNTCAHDMQPKKKTG